MLTVLDSQLHALRDRQEQDLITRLIQFLCEVVSAEGLGGGDVPAARHSVELRIREARVAGLDSEQDIALYVLATFVAAPGFPDHEPALLDAIADPGIPLEERAAALQRYLEVRGV